MAIYPNSPGTAPWLRYPGENMFFFAFTWVQVKKESDVFWSISQCLDSQTWGTIILRLHFFLNNCMDWCKVCGQCCPNTFGMPITSSRKIHHPLRLGSGRVVPWAPKLEFSWITLRDIFVEAKGRRAGELAPFLPDCSPWESGSHTLPWQDSWAGIGSVRTGDLTPPYRALLESCSWCGNWENWFCSLPSASGRRASPIPCLEKERACPGGMDTGELSGTLGPGRMMAGCIYMGQKIKLRRHFSYIYTETFRPMILVVVGGESPNQEMGERSHPQE